MSCQQASAKATTLRAQAVTYASAADAQELRDNIGLTTAVDTATIAVVSADSVCDAVTRAVNASASAPRSTSLIVVKFGAFYAACSPENPGIVAVYILDDQYRLKTVLLSS